MCALRYFDEGGMGEDANDPFESEEGKTLFVSSMNNCAMCSLKFSDFSGALDAAGKVLKVEAENVKALFRRGQARAGLGLLEEARTDLLAAGKLAPSDKGIRAALADVKSKRAAAKEKEKSQQLGRR